MTLKSINGPSIKTLQKNFEELLKLEPGLAQALRTARQAAPEAARVLASKIFKDTLVTRLGNLLAYRDFLSRHANDGVHVHIDLNRFGEINKYHGDPVGDQAIFAAGNTLADVSRMMGGKAFRPHGDELKAWFPTVEQAHSFAREFRDRLAKLPKVGSFNPEIHAKMGLTPEYKGHNVSASIGLGYNPDHAEKALMNAKFQLGPKDLPSAFAKGEAPTVIHSALHEQPHPEWKPGKGRDPGTNATPNPQPNLRLNNPLNE